MFDDEFHLIMEQDFEAVRVNEEHETDDSDATEIDEDDHSAVSGEWVGSVCLPPSFD